MRIRIVDEATLQSPSARNIRTYLRVRGWTRTGRQPDTWTLEGADGTYEVIAPSSGARDFPLRVAELLRTLSIVEDRSEEDILGDLITFSFDIQYVRTLHPGPPGTAPLRDATAAFAAAQNMLAAAATSLEYPKLVLPPHRPAQTNELMKRVLAGPTSKGSYVISIWVPVPPRLTQEEDSILFDATNEPFERLTTLQLQRAISQIRKASDEAPERGIDPFVEGQSFGVSANLCESLVSLSGEDGNGFEVQFSWALDRPVLDPSPRIAFEPEAVPILQEAARELRLLEPEEDVRVRGIVVRLHREERSGPGEVTISGTFSGDAEAKLHRVHVPLTEDAYNEAITAHENYADVEVTGTFYYRGTHKYLREVRGFTVLPPVGE